MTDRAINPLLRKSFMDATGMDLKDILGDFETSMKTLRISHDALASLSKLQKMHDHIHERCAAAIPETKDNYGTEVRDDKVVGACMAMMIKYLYMMEYDECGYKMIEGIHYARTTQKSSL
jgi:hypothetical protein